MAEPEILRAPHTSTSVLIYSSENQFWIERLSTPEIVVAGKPIIVGERVALRCGDEIILAGVACRWNVQDPLPKQEASRNKGITIFTGRMPTWIRSTFWTTRGTQRIDSDRNADTAPLARSCSAGAHLHMFAGRDVESVVDLIEEQAEKRASGLQWLIGSGRAASLVIEAPGVSERHASIFFGDGRWWVTDEFAKNGLVVNDRKVLTADLSSGDRIWFGPVESVIHIPPSAISPSRNWVYLLAAVIGVAVASAIALLLEHVLKY